LVICSKHHLHDSYIIYVITPRELNQYISLLIKTLKCQILGLDNPIASNKAIHSSSPLARRWTIYKTITSQIKRQRSIKYILLTLLDLLNLSLLNTPQNNRWWHSHSFSIICAQYLFTGNVIPNILTLWKYLFCQ
jgi:hypothetical protein